MTARALPLLIALAACGDRRDAAGAAVDEATAAAAPAGPAPAAPPPPFRPLDTPRLDELARVELPGFTIVHRDRSRTSLVVAIRADDAPLRGLVTITPCLACLPPELDAWRAAAPELRALLPGAVEADPATTFELGTVELAGRRCISSYELGALAYGDELEATHGFRIYCNDGAIELVVRVDDDAILGAGTPEAARRADRATVEAPALAIAAAFLVAL